MAKSEWKVLSENFWESWMLTTLGVSFRKKNTITHERLIFPAYRNQSIDLFCKSVDWFLYDLSTGC